MKYYYLVTNTELLLFGIYNVEKKIRGAVTSSSVFNL